MLYFVKFVLLQHFGRNRDKIKISVLENTLRDFWGYELLRTPLEIPENTAL